MAFNIGGSLTQEQIKKLNSISNDSANETRRKSQVLDKDAFLKLMMVQLQNQNPLNPTDNTEYMNQMAQFSSVEQLSNISKTTETNNELSALISKQLEDMNKLLVANGPNNSTDKTLLKQNAQILDELIKLNSGLAKFFESSANKSSQDSEALLSTLMGKS